MAKSQPTFQQPQWWNNAHNAAWEHAREAFRTQWEARPAAEPSAAEREWDEVEPAIRFGFGRRRTKQTAAEPSAQRVEPSTQREEPSTQREEPKTQREEPPDWDPEVEATLEQEWDSMHHAGDEGAAPRLWHDIRQFVHRGWFGP